MSNRDRCITEISSIEEWSLPSDSDLAEKLIEGKNTPLSECVPEDEVDW